ncbi:MAG TPA: TonB-dependent receptor [Vicinamibacterales bacterium]
MKQVTRVLAVALLAGSAPLLAQSVPVRDLGRATLEDLMNITVTTATRTSEGAAGAPARVQVVTSDQILRRGYRSLADLLKDLPDFKVDLAGDPDFPTQITVTGSRGADRIVLLLDGVRVSSPTNEPLPILANYPVHAARQIEIVFGPASALYGADAFSAVINIISRDVADAPGLSVSTSVGQFGLYNMTGVYTARLGTSATLLLAGQGQYDRQPDLSRYYPDDFQGLQGQRSGTFNTIFGPMTLARPVSPDYRIPMSAHSFEAMLRAGGWQLLLFQSQSRVSTAPAYTPDNAVYSADAYNRNTLVVGAGTYTRAIARATSTSTVTFSRHELDPRSGYLNVFSNMNRSYKYAFGSMAKGEEQLSWKPAPSIALTAGGTVERFFAMPQSADLDAPIVSRETPGMIQGTNIPDEAVRLHYSNTGVFGQAQYAVTPSVAVTLGARGDYNSRYGASFNPRAGIVAHPFDGTTIKILAGRAFLAPSPYQTYGHYGSFYSTDGGRTYASRYWHVPNPDLKPQRTKTLELGLQQALGGSLQLSASGFVSRSTNLIKDADADRAYAGTYRGWPVDYIEFPVNEGQATLYGGTFGFDFLHVVDLDRRISAHGGVTFVDGRTTEGAPAESDNLLPLGAMAPVQLRLGADVDWRRWSLAPRLSVESAQRLIAPTAALTRRTLPGYATLDVNIRRREVVRHVDAFLTLENAFDVRYRSINARAYLNPEELVGGPQNPRRVTVGFDVRFK